MQPEHGLCGKRTNGRGIIGCTVLLNEAATRRGKSGGPRPEARSRTAGGFEHFIARCVTASFAASGRHLGLTGHHTKQPLLQHDHA